MTLRAGFIGLGNQGRPIAENLAASSHPTIVYDVLEEPVAALAALGATRAGTAREVGAEADVIGICVPEDDHVRAVVLGPDGVLAGCRPGSVIAIHSTILPETAEALARVAAEREVAVLDACVTGGAARAAQRELTLLVGGEARVLERARPVLEISAAKVIHAGPVGSGAKLKLCINVITYLQWAAAQESHALARAVGLPQEVLEEAGLSNGQITPLMQGFLALHKAPEEARKSEALQSTLRGFMQIAEKDLAWALSLARRANVAMPVTGVVSQSMARIYGVEDPGRR